ncbi:hypothetical protein [Zobellia roscoffensis]|uniref:hypothetical protein n=1 Tax=Zobellia roscoffensis TaxID=2779508 RepID=UPI00188C9E79|nr:hypothetical protein [Zobellia roscoffensis]
MSTIIILVFQTGVYAQETMAINHKGTQVSVRNTIVTAAPIAPSDPLQNDIWFDTVAEVTKIYNGTVWLTINLDALSKKEDSVNKSTDTNLADATNTKFPTELAVKTYVDTKFTASVDDDITAVSFDGANLTVDEGATSFSTDLSSLKDSDWFQEASGNTATNINQNIYTMGNVGIGTNSPNAQLDIESTGVPLNIKPSTATPTGTQTGQIFMDDEGILYTYDGSRSKWLSVDRQNLTWARGIIATNQYLTAHNSLSSANGYRMLRDATITGITAQANALGSWSLLILKNNSSTSIAYITLSGEAGKHARNLNVDINEGDYIQAYCLGLLVNNPLGTIEFAWRK